MIMPERQKLKDMKIVRFEFVSDFDIRVSDFSEGRLL